jgi:glycine cleavage system H lipoate-binding protein
MNLEDQTHFEIVQKEADGFWMGLNLNAKEEFKTIQWIQLPSTGAKILKNEVLLAIESTKAIFELESPVSCTILQIDFDPENPLDLRLKVQPDA